ncbi:MAG: ATP-binding protein, partial [Bacteroidales bacterium]
ESLVYINPTNLSQVILNICTNAMQAIPEKKGKIHIKTELLHGYIEAHRAILPNTLPVLDYVMLSISDTGIGMSNETMLHVFDPYFTTKKIGEGSGLGLSVAYGIVKKNGGEITVESKLHEGSTFKVFLPVSHQNNKQENTELDIVNFFDNKTIMIVDDEPAITEVLNKSLVKYGYKITFKNNPLEALSEIEKNALSYNILLTDITMPYINGIELAKSVLEINSEIKIIFMTGFENILSEKDKNFINNNFTLIEKPVDVKKLIMKIRFL